MPFICRFCHQKKLNLVFEANKSGRKNPTLFACTNCGFGIHGPIVHCRDCGLYYVAENLSQEKISTYYEVADDPLYFAEQPARKITFGRYLKRLEKIFPRKGKLLDVGTNTGLFVRLALNSGWEAQGLEPNIWAAEYAKKNYNIDLINKPFKKNILPKNSFDVITMWDVIEHFVDPVTAIKTVHWYLKPGGMFAFSTVDPESFFARAMGTHWSWYMEMHRVFLTHFSTRRYLQEEGFSKIIFCPHFRHLSLGYLATRLAAVNPTISQISGSIVHQIGLAKVIVPYYANDLYDCYAFKT